MARFMVRVAGWVPLWFVVAVLYGLSVSPAMIPAAPLDFDVYVRGASSFLSGADALYEPAGQGSLVFTYPPFAALLFVPVTWINATVGGVLLTLVGLVALFDMTRRILLAVAPQFVWVFAPLSAAAVFLEPVYDNFKLGQINLLLAWLIVFALTSVRPAVQGFVFGVVISFKLTPVVFVAWLVVTRRFRAAVWSFVGFVACVAVGWLVMPASSAVYWSGAGFSSARVGHVWYVPNQSVNGMMWRTVGESFTSGVWLVSACVVGLLACVASWWMHRRLVAHRSNVVSVVPIVLAGLLCSPVSWTHHYTVMWPLLVAVGSLCVVSWVCAWRRVVVGVGVAVWVAVWWAAVPWRVVVLDGPAGSHQGLAWFYANSYVLVALVSLVVLPAVTPRAVDEAVPSGDASVPSQPDRQLRLPTESRVLR